MNPFDPDHLQRLLDDHQLTLNQLTEMLGLEPHDLMFGVKRLPVTALAQLADMLGESPLGLPAQEQEAPDRARLGAHLAGMPKGATRDDLAYALGWTLDRLERALAALDSAMTDLGIRIVADNGRLSLTGRLEHTSATSRQRVARGGDGTIEIEVAKAVHQLMLYQGPVTRANEVALEEARRQGLVIAHVWYLHSGITEPVRFSLCLDDPDADLRRKDR